MDRYRVKPATKVDLKKRAADDKSAFPAGKAEAEKELLKLNQKLDELQDLLYAGHKHRVLIILQGMDTSGKDGVIRHVFEHVDPLGVRAVSFKQPTSEELDHDYLWRVHRQLPANGEIAIFNRSHYEEVLVVRVHDLVPEKIWKKRYDHINSFERMLVDEGTIILKFFLHMSRKEQAKRLQERLDEKEKNWKFNPNDLKERELWPQYIKAYEEALSKTSKKWAPWYVVPSDRKWYRNLVIAAVLVDTLARLDLKPPKVDFNPGKIVIK
jgi:PPK2 family polyphosphate:nucleotide phosphotransferase